MKWISVKKKKPELFEDVLVYDEEYDTIQVDYLRDDMWDYKKNGMDWFKSYEATHWMPLPDKPKKRKKKA